MRNVPLSAAVTALLALSEPVAIRPPASPRRRCEILAQLFRRTTRAVAWRVALNAPALVQRPGIDDVEPELIDEVRYRRFRITVVAGDHQSPPVLRAGREAVRR